MKLKFNRYITASVTALAALSSSAWALDRIKQDNTDNLNLATSWDTAPGAGDVGVWDSTVTGVNTVNLGGNLSWGGLRIEDPGGDVSIGGANSLTLGASGLDTGSTRNLTFTNSGNITLNGPLSGSTTLTLNSNATKNWSNAAGGGMTAVDFTGTLVLRGGTGASGSFSGNWLAFGANGVGTITQTGVFHLDTGASLTNRGDFILAGGWGDGIGSNPKLSLASLTGWGDFRSDWGNTTDPGNRTISVHSAGTHEFQGRIVQNNNSTRSIHFEKLGVGTQILSGENAYQNTIVGAGTLQIGNGGATGNIGLGTVSVASGATLEFNRSGLLDYKASARMRNVSGAGDIVLDGGAKLFNYTGSGLGFDDANSWNNFSGDLIIKGGSEFQTIRNGRTAMGTAQVILGDATSSGKLSQIEGNWAWTNNIELVGSANEILNNGTTTDRWNKLQGVLSGDGNVTFRDTTGAMSNGNLGFILTGANTMSGTITVDTFVRVGGITGDSTSTNAGTGGTLGDSDVVINSGKRLTFSRSDSHTVDNTISGAGALHVGATGITGTDTQAVTLTADNTYTGATSVINGTLVIGASGSLANTTTTIGVNGTLAGGGSIGGATAIEGTHSPGFSPGTQTFTNGLSYADTATLNWELTDNTTGGRGTDYDAVNVSGGSFALTTGATIDLSFGGSVDFLNAFWETNQEWRVVDLSGSATAADSNLFIIGSISGGANWDPALGSFGTLRKDGSTTEESVYLTWTAIPEPGAALLGGLGMLLLLRRRR